MIIIKIWISFLTCDEHFAEGHLRGSANTSGLMRTNCNGYADAFPTNVRLDLILYCPKWGVVFLCGCTHHGRDACWGNLVFDFKLQTQIPIFEKLSISWTRSHPTPLALVITTHNCCVCLIFWFFGFRQSSHHIFKSVLGLYYFFLHQIVSSEDTNFNVWVVGEF